MRKYLLTRFPWLETERLILRELRLDDQAALYHIFSDTAVTRHYNVQTFTSMDDSVAMLKRRIGRFHQGRGIRWGITLRGNDTLIGSCGYNAWYQQYTVGEIGYELGQPYWNRGIMTEALAAIITFGFNLLHLRAIEAWVLPGNEASARVLVKLGFQSEGVQRARGYWNGTFHDLEQFWLLPEMFWPHTV